MDGDKTAMDQNSIKENYMSGLHALIQGTQSLSLAYDLVWDMESDYLDTQQRLKDTQFNLGEMEWRAVRAEKREKETRAACYVLKNSLAASEEWSQKIEQELRMAQQTIQDVRSSQLRSQWIKEYKASIEFRKLVLDECDAFYIQGFTESIEKVITIDPNFPVKRLKYLGEDDEIELYEDEQGGVNADQLPN
ncbi:hypothetical protein O6P43_028166 [Quillaja saponaria]|uniref:Uncharacterized protein n=1 Tax=Quillaja saponaria TaxID=32244 RepID=A0AAD7KXF2_QUISA|nr:hypothetical protein O6P43_028166 [Quillaja saponaria]